MPRVLRRDLLIGRRLKVLGRDEDFLERVEVRLLVQVRVGNGMLFDD